MPAREVGPYTKLMPGGTSWLKVTVVRDSRLSLVLAESPNRLMRCDPRVIAPRANLVMSHSLDRGTSECVQFAESHYKFVLGAHFAVMEPFERRFGVVGETTPTGLVGLPGSIQVSARRTTTMKIRITRQCPATIDGFSIAQLMVDRVYDIKDSTAAFLIATGCAEPYHEPHSDTPRSSDRQSGNSAR